MDGLGGRIRQAREAQNLTVKKVARLVGVDESVIRKIENDTCGVRADRLALFARLFRVRSSWLLGEDRFRELKSVS